MSFKLKSEGVLGSERSECCWRRSKQRKANVEERGKAGGSTWRWSVQLWTVSMCEEWLGCFKNLSLLSGIHPTPPQCSGECWGIIGDPISQAYEGVPSQVLHPTDSARPHAPSLLSTGVPDLAPSATPPTIWSSCLLQSSRTIAQNLRMGYICISSDYCCLLFLDFHWYLYIQVSSGK